MSAAPGGLAPLETATAIVFGRAEAAPTLPRRVPLTPVAALERALLGALRRPPCAVAFSGGRDSSALLAVAVRTARSHGLAEPVPVTLRFPEATAAAEDEWQELVVRQLGCADWIRLEQRDELDLLGPVAQRVMAWEGQPFPYNLHLLLPLMEACAGGSLVTGFGGDQALVEAGRELDVLARRTRPVRRDALRIAAGAAPAAVRRIALRGRVGLTFPWLTAEGDAALTEAWLVEAARRPLRWDARLRELWRARVSRLVIGRIASLASRVGVVAVHPFLDPSFVSAFAALGGATGFPDRTAAMRALFADDLPDRVSARTTKASFDEVLWNRHARRFAGELDAAALEPVLRRLAVERLVDPAALVAHWSGARPLANSFVLLQACRLAYNSPTWRRIETESE